MPIWIYRLKQTAAPRKNRRQRIAASCRLSLGAALVSLGLAACEVLDPPTPAEAPVQPVSKPDPPAKKPPAQSQKPQQRPLSKKAIKNPAVIAEAQSLLLALGYKTGKADGIVGPKTRRAIHQFQGEAGLSRDGRVSEVLLGHLREERQRRQALKQGTNPDRSAARSAKVAPPTHRAGTRFVYSDGRVLTIDSADGDYLLWRSNRGEEISSYRNFILPPLAWTDGLERGMRSFELDPATLWPLRTGSQVSFVARQLVNKAANPDQRVVVAEKWRCEIGEAEKITVVAGRFDTLKITCRRKSDDGTPDLTRVWYYAPTIKHFVRVNDIYDAVEQDRHVELIAIQPPRDEWPPAAQAGLNRALQHALESGRPGEEFPWQSSAVETNVTIAALQPYQRGDGKNCRIFVQTWITTSSRDSYPGTACRSGSGAWFIPGLEGALDTALR